ncbi:ABC transporter related protein [Spirochaeta thermophila DSM 6578]|uniref:ABC transporter related protein n=1 Tax=Winmispira thermophila (strain ATCC 700085 / DSM 6578 / Z-1203) TaxID=869211 RepID=G0GAE7_WINT7|nr:ATP-binding cassette domain-containing protein [Spirochaeta thermophila]AEJ61766.1 ABC transporter related protein [Spirochaeta thermophila DSM 6578]
MIEVQHLTKRYGIHTAVHDVSFSIQKGEIVGFLGPNGAGKSTTMNILTGYLSATEGTVVIDGVKLLEEPEECKKKIGYLPENPPLYGHLTVDEFLRFVADLKYVPRRRQKEHLESIMEKVGILHVRGRLVRNLSKGYKQRVGLAQALVGDPEILILDEPTIGLDPRQIIDIRTLIKDLGKDRTVILSSHILPEVSMVCKRVLIINNGVIVADDTPENLAKRLMGTNTLLLRIEGTREAVEKALSAVKEVQELEFRPSQEEGTVEVVAKAPEETDIRKAVFTACARAGLPILQMRSLDISLEDIFLQLVTQESQTKEAIA